MDNLLLAWRNLWRNPRRTLLTAAALSLGVLCMVAVEAYMQGLFGRMVETTANGLTGHAQLHAPGWRQTRDDQLRLPEAAPLLARARQLPGVQAAAPRSWGAALLAIGDRSRSVLLLGVLPSDEVQVGRWPERLSAGRFLDPTASAELGGELVIGAPLPTLNLPRITPTARHLQPRPPRSRPLGPEGLCGWLRQSQLRVGEGRHPLDHRSKPLDRAGPAPCTESTQIGGEAYRDGPIRQLALGAWPSPSGLPAPPRPPQQPQRRQQRQRPTGGRTGHPQQP